MKNLLLALLIFTQSGVSQAAVTFAVRGNSLTPYRQKSLNIGPRLNTTPPTIDVDAGAIGGSSIGCKASTKIALYDGYGNIPNTQAGSALIRLKANASPTSMGGLWGFSNGNYIRSGILFWHSTDLKLYQGSAVGSFGLNSAIAKTAWTATTGQWFDLVLTWTGTTSAGGYKTYIDSVLQTSLTSTQARPAAPTDMDAGVIGLCTDLFNDNPTNFSVNEFVLWDEIIDPTVVTTENGGSTILGGQSRTQYVFVTPLLGGYSTIPIAANIRNGIGYSVAGLPAYGTAYIPTASDVRFGVLVDATTGTAYIPTAANTRFGVNVDATAGTAYIPVANDVRLATNVDNTTGNLRVPLAANVLTGVPFDYASTGTLTTPTQDSINILGASVMTRASQATVALDATVAKAATALTSAIWTNTKAGYIDAAISSISGGSGGGSCTVGASTIRSISAGVWNDYPAKYRVPQTFGSKYNQLPTACRQ